MKLCTACEQRHHDSDPCPELDEENEKLKEDLGFWKKEAMLHSDAREQFKKEWEELKKRFEDEKALTSAHLQKERK